MLKLSMRHIIEAQQFMPEDLELVFQIASEFKEMHRSNYPSLEKVKVATFFYQASTRTRSSFEAAALNLGCGVVSTENANEFSSVAKGETIADTMKVIGAYVDLIVMRHFAAGSLKIAAANSPVPIINAGDGIGQHPTQALLDAFTIQSHFERLNNLKVALVGDLTNGRTVRSLVYLMSHYPNNKFIFVSPRILRMRDDILDYLRLHNIEFVEQEDFSYDADVVYMTRLQKDNFGDNLALFEKAFARNIMDNNAANQLPDDSIIMHPLPRGPELPEETDSNHRARYMQQVENGLYVRMALLWLMLKDI